MYWRRKYIPWIPIILFFVADFLFACMSWQEIRSTIGWVRVIPQKSEFKLRHIVQFTPQCLYLLHFCKMKYQLTSSKYLYSAGAVILMGIISEVLQLFIETRIFSFLDIFWNIIAAGLGVLIYYVYEITTSPVVSRSVRGRK